MASSLATVNTEVPAVITTSTIVVSAIFPALSMASILLRFRARYIAKQTLMADDWWIVVSWFVTLSTSVLFWVFGAMAGINYLKGNLHTALLRTTQCLYANAFCLQIALATVKVSILFFYKRVFAIPVFRVIANVVIFLVASWAIIYIFLFTFENDPVSGSWTGEGRVRINFAQIGMSQAITSICLDMVVLCLPLYFVYKLHLRKEKKLAVMMIFWLGGFCVVAAVLRLVFLLKSQQATDSTKSTAGFTGLHDEATTVVFITIEPNCSIIAACLPCYAPLFRHGRRLESMINSARSVFSLSSRDSGRNTSMASGSIPGSNSKSDDNAKGRNGISEDSEAGSGNGEPLAASLNGWTHAQHVVDVASTELASANKKGIDNHKPGIEVIKSFETRNEAG